MPSGILGPQVKVGFARWNDNIKDEVLLVRRDSINGPRPNESPKRLYTKVLKTNKWISEGRYEYSRSWEVRSYREGEPSLIVFIGIIPKEKPTPRGWVLFIDVNDKITPENCPHICRRALLPCREEFQHDIEEIPDFQVGIVGPPTTTQQTYRS
jgi:hypothetical protein